MNVLYIDTRDNKRIIVRLKTKKKEFKLESKASVNKAQETLPLVEKILDTAGISFSKIDKIEVEKGPGSFTGLRVGISVANALSFALLKNVNDKEQGEQEFPEY